MLKVGTLVIKIKVTKRFLQDKSLAIAASTIIAGDFFQFVLPNFCLNLQFPLRLRATVWITKLQPFNPFTLLTANHTAFEFLFCSNGGCATWLFKNEGDCCTNKLTALTILRQGFLLRLMTACAFKLNVLSEIEFVPSPLKNSHKTLVALLSKTLSAK